MAPAALWAALAVGLQLWAAGHAVPAQVAFTTYASDPWNVCQTKEFHHQMAQENCSQCPPGCRVKESCTKTSDTVCVPCEDSTYTQLWNRVSRCLSCDSRCSSDQVEMKPCTAKQNRVCVCKPGRFCVLNKQEGCRLCTPLRKCRPGFGVVKPGTATSDVLCAPCALGTFSDTTSSTDVCRPHRICSVVAIPGNASMDAVCSSVSPTLRVSPESARVPQPAPTRSQQREPTLGSSTAPSTSFLLPMGSAPAEGVSAGDISLPVSVIVGVTASVLLIIAVVNCVIMTQKKKKPSCLQREAKVPHLPADKARGVPGPEQQLLLTTAPSSSSSSLESSASTDGRAPTGNQSQAPGVEKACGASEARASCGSSAESSGSHGTQVNVTCIVNVCSSSSHGSQCSSQASSMTGDTDASPSASPKDEQFPFSKEECASQTHLETPETLLQTPEEKPMPFGVPDAGMKPS
ncbi:tumor necrosis factor receptor superfamily member 1B isoform X1 [Otolemur garnettii]|uniref:tumor necrosis factor receptor superfamily member 1B isoform X1 n=1 Tax=Otolemur garnettii TaxID=30611 RepID=UPI000274115E|nr:tumor necrosis factor receptor superfamily member 1B isoform X1 [Otolemur garnettii]